MTRENAIKFLRDIRLGIDYLQNTYSSNSLKTDSHSHVERDSSTAMTVATEAPTTMATHTEAVVDKSLLEQPATLSPEIVKVIERLPSLLKINDLKDEAGNIVFIYSYLNFDTRLFNRIHTGLR